MSQTAHLIYFSPTGTTRKVLAGIARGLGAKRVVHYDVTLPNTGPAAVLTDGIALIGVPVYSGRVPELCLRRFRGISALRVPCILVALYGNREFEDALVELRDFAVGQGFHVLAAGAFIGEHSYSTPQAPIAAGRPDAADLALAERFGRQVADKISSGGSATPSIEGHIPYRERGQLGGVAPETDPQTCTLCGQCAAVCPTGVIEVTSRVTTRPDSCVMCCACIKACPAAARTCAHPRIAERRALLLQNCRAPKVPKVFL